MIFLIISLSYRNGMSTIYSVKQGYLNMACSLVVQYCKIRCNIEGKTMVSVVST
jgi:hypothetical protein